MNCKMKKQEKTLHQMKVFLLQIASSTLMPKKAMKQQTRLQQSQKIRTLTRSALMKTIPQLLDLKTKPKHLPKELQKMLMQSLKKMTRSPLTKPQTQKRLLKKLSSRIQTTAKKPTKTKTMKMKVQKQS